jgi:hypothetical protein
MADPVEYIVTLAPGAAANGVADALRAKGFTATSVLGELAMLVGTADPDGIEAYKSIEGVTAVEPSQPIQLSPGDPQ